jgi:diacylglycerol kinase (ATP)
MKSKVQKLLFVINPSSGNGEIDYTREIELFFKEKAEKIEVYELSKSCTVDDLKTVIKKAKVDRVIAVGGDGTLKLVAECLLNENIPIGIIPAGSANGMAKELGISMDLKEALNLTTNGKLRKIHAIMINHELCIHLSDIGFNAYLVKKFDELPTRGMLTYAKATWHAFWNHRKMDVEFKIKDRIIKEKAAMVAIANATQYGTGLQINPNGKLDDELFEVILVKEYSIIEILKIWISNLPWNPKKIESFQTAALKITTQHKVHFQVDGEYLGKVSKLDAKIIPQSLMVITP